MAGEDRFIPGRTDYWNKNILDIDAEKKAYRSIPVPAYLDKSQTNIDGRTRSELLVDFLGTRNDFPVAFPNVAGLSPEDQLDAFRQYIESVEAAPEHQQEDAQRSLGGHLKDIGTSIKGGLLSGLNSILGIPGVKSTMGAISFPGEEITAQLLYNFAKLIPEEQDIERGVKEWKQENPDQPWWKEGFLTPAVREKGFGVPMGVHLPMEIILDPLNLIPLGAVFKLSKAPLTIARLTGKGYTVAESLEYMKRAKRLKQAYIQRQKVINEEVAAAAKFDLEFDKLVEQGAFVGTRDQFGHLIQEKPRRAPGEHREGPGRQERELSPEELGDAADDVDVDAMVRNMDISDAGKDLYARLPIEYQKMLNIFGTDFENDLNLLAGLPWRKVWELGGKEVPQGTKGAKEVMKGHIRKAPDREGLKRMIDADGYWGEFGAEGIMAQWALKLLYHTGVRPNEIPLLRWDAINDVLDPANKEAKKFLFLRHSDKEVSQRLLDNDALTFLDEYRTAMDLAVGTGTKPSTNLTTQAFKLPGRPRVKDKDPFSPIRELNHMFGEASKHSDFSEFGPGLADFYSGNGILTYVFRLSKANDVYTKGGTNNIVATKETLGHNSIVNTSLYVSLFNHTLNTDMETLLKTLGTKTNADGSVESLLTKADLEKYNQELYEKFNVLPDMSKVDDPTDARWFIDEPDEALATHTRGKTTGKGKKTKRLRTKLEMIGGQLDAFSNLSVAKMNTKGYQDPLRLEAQNALNDIRTRVIESAIDRNIDYDPAIFITKVDGPGAQAAQAQIKDAINMLESLSIFAAQLSSAAGEAQLIKMSKEVAGKSKLDADTQAIYNQIGVDANARFHEIQSWYEPISQLKDRYILILEESKKLPGIQSADIKLDYDRTTARLKAAFTHLDDALIQRDISRKKQGFKGGATAHFANLHDVPIFGKLMLMAQRDLDGNLRTKGVNTGVKEQAERDAWELLSAEEKAEQMNSGVGYIVGPKKGTKNRPNVDADDPTKQLWRGENVQDHYMVLGYLKRDGLYYKAGDDPAEIMFVEVEQLAAEYLKEGMFVRSRVPNIAKVPITNFDLWSVNSSRQWAPHMIRNGASGKAGSLTPESVLNAIMNYGGDATRSTSLRGMRGMTAPKDDYNSSYSKLRLENNGFLIRVGGEGDTATYRWSEDIVALWHAERGQDSPRWGAMLVDPPGGGRGGRGADDGKPPPSDPGEPTFASLPEDEWSKVENLFEWPDEQGKMHSIGKTIIQPRGMDQKMRFAGDSFRKTFESFFNRFPSKFRKFARFFVPQTFAATPAAKIRWEFIMAKSEGQEVSSNIGHMLDKLHDVFGSNRRNGRGTKIKLKGGVGVDPKTGRLDDGGLLENDDYFRYEGVTKSAKNAAKVEKRVDIIGPGEAPSFPAGGVALRYPKLVEGGQVWGPIAEMEQRFLEFQRLDSAKWTNARIIKERQKYNHLEVMQDLTTVLNTSRTDLFRYYDLTAEQLRYWDYYHQVGPHLVEMLRKAGFDVDSKRSILGKAAGKFRASFVPSLFLEQTSDIRVGFQAGAGQMGMRPSQMKRHDYYWQIANKMDQGQGAGRIKHDLYNTDPILALQRQAESYYDYVATERFMDKFAKLGILHSEARTAPKVLEQIRNYKATGEEMSYGQKMSAQKFFGAGWRRMTNETIEEKHKSLIEMSANWKNLDLREAVQKGVVKRHPLYRTELPVEASREFAVLFSDEFTKSSAFLTVPSAIANTMRVLATGADLGVMLLHGLGGLGMMASPNIFMPMGQRFAWAKGSYNMGKAMWSPKVRTEWYIRTQETRREMQKYGTAFFRSTHIEDLPLPGMFTKGRGRPGLKKPGIKQAERAVELAWTMPERMMNGFGFFLDVSKTEMWKVQSKMIQTHFGALNHAGQPLKPGDVQQTPRQLQQMEDAFNDMAASLNAIHGTLQPAAVGIPSKQRNFESAFLLYAALYRRSAVAVMKNLMSTSKWRRGMALESVTGMLAAGGSIAWAIKSAGLNDDVLNPGSADFMSIKVGGMRVGIGTPFYSFMRMGKDIMDQMVDDPEGLAEVNFSDNALLKWFRSGSSPITSIGIDLVMGQDFIGDPLRDTTGGWEVNKIGDRFSRSLMPFWIDTIQDSIWGSQDMPPQAGLAEFFGLRTSPQSAYGRLKAARNTAILLDEDPALMKWKQEQERKNLPIDGDTIPKLLLRQLRDRHPGLQDLEVEIAEDVERRGSYIRKRQDEYIQATKLNMKGRGPKNTKFNPTDIDEPEGLEMRLLGLEAEFTAHNITGRELREKWTLLETEHRGRNQELAEIYEDVLDTFSERRVGDMNNAADQFLYDHWYDRYRQEVTGSAALHDMYGNFDSDEFKRRQQKFKDFMITTYGPESWKYIEDMKKHGKVLPPVLKRLADARDKELGEFWDIPDKYFNKANAELIHHWRGAQTREAKEWFQARHPYIKEVLQHLREVQDYYRKTRPTVDALLVEFYDYRALTLAGQVIERKRLQTAMSRPTYPTPTISNYVVNPEMMFQETAGVP